MPFGSPVRKLPSVHLLGMQLSAAFDLRTHLPGSLQLVIQYGLCPWAWLFLCDSLHPNSPFSCLRFSQIHTAAWSFSHPALLPSSFANVRPAWWPESCPAYSYSLTFYLSWVFPPYSSPFVSGLLSGRCIQHMWRVWKWKVQENIPLELYRDSPLHCLWDVFCALWRIPALTSPKPYFPLSLWERGWSMLTLKVHE